MEYCGGGDLSAFIRSRRTLSEYLAKRFLQQIGKWKDLEELQMHIFNRYSMSFIKYKDNIFF